MTEQRYKIIGHALGVKIDKYNGDKTLPDSYYRNFFQAGENHPDYPELVKMVDEGLMARTIEIFGAPLFHVSRYGKMLFEREFKIKNHDRQTKIFD